ncbi:methyltransferase [Philodulcilactobacillus myokoensis]|uniref:Methyltransferase n=2 Tax=Philodulcilactobacillus myokoensis TaxID=2929573 RepID=A0A9W6AZU2_9LACO|nr:methyltransferase [Philodulcilactobacillus myokoensis]
MLLTNLDWFLRLVLAMFCGGLVGYERSRQLKSAGIRTHMVVAVGSALVMIVSKYGFYDILSLHNIALDPSRIAAQIVSGISFLGAGTIIIGRNRVSGLTTAAGVWSTAMIGMAVGAGMYFIGIAATIFIVVIQFVFHDDSILNILINRIHIRLNLEINNDGRAIERIEKILGQHHVELVNLQVTSADETRLGVRIDGMINHKINPSKIILALERDHDVVRITSEHR